MYKDNNRLSNFFQNVKIPDSVTLIFFILVIFTALTWVIPAGEYQKELRDGREIVVNNSYAHVENSPQGLWAMLQAPLKGFAAAAEIIAFVFLVGGAFGVLNRTGAINASLHNLIGYTAKKPKMKKFVIPLVMTIFSVAGATFGMSEETIVFIMITIPLAMALGYDSLVGVAMTFMAASAGFAGALTNPFTIGIAQDIAGIQMFSGWEYRILVWFVVTIATIIFVMRYAAKVEKNPLLSPVYELDKQRIKPTANSEDDEFTPRRKMILLALFLTLAMLIVGVTNWNWYISEISALFIALGIASGIIFKLSASDTVKAFMEGAKEMMTAAIVIAMAKGLYVVITDGKIIDTILYAIASHADGLSPAISVQIMFLFQSVIHFFVPSGSGQAALTMPIMAPLSDLMGISRQTAVLAFQLGDGLNTQILPTSGVTMGVLAVAKIPYSLWLRWVFKFVAVLFLLAMLLLIPPVVFFEWQ